VSAAARIGPVQIDTCDLDDGIEALAYWRARRERLPWHRRRDRSEADEMVARWERRVRSAIVDDDRAALATRLEGGVLVLRTHARSFGRRWARRLVVAAIAGAAIMGAFVMLVVAALF
jgi:hypothetical protein